MLQHVSYNNMMCSVCIFLLFKIIQNFILFAAGLAVGIPVNEFNEIKDLEMMTFRRNMLQVCKDVTEERDNQGPFNQAMYVYPPDVENSPDLPVHLQQKVNEGKGNVLTHLPLGDLNEILDMLFSNWG